MQPIQGLHHITAFAADPQRNVDFYHHVLGQRLVKTTVNFDDPGTYHFYYGDNVGSPGTIMTFFPWPMARRGSLGNGEVGASAYTIRPESLVYWQQRLADFDVPTSEVETRFGQAVLPFQDPDGMPLELIVSEEPTTFEVWAEGPIPAEHALRGFHGVTLWLADYQATGELLTEQMGYRFVGQESNRYRYQGGANALGKYIDILVDPNRPLGRVGAGSVHHIAFRTQTDEEQLDYQRLLSQVGFGVTPVRDRQYFHSIYFRSPGGVLFEVATDAPGFAVDEPVAELGRHLKLPPWLEPNREKIEAVLPKFERREVISA
ncbi:MAG TPA: ring-cleaving dioxygenase [Anaerolineae bacterium]|mgnify:CR=1 FL=1|nr:ring-cleaving dioxygenase [Anaerolineae bacterium]HMR67730.1 ring-cleaving dioxygenase [Anaerolineae bacterium]